MTAARTTIKLMADYDCWALWGVTEIGNIDPETLPLCDATKRNLRDWADAYSATLNRNDPAASGFETPEAEAAFDQEGRRLLACLRNELTDMNVQYRDPVTGRLEDDPRATA